MSKPEHTREEELEGLLAGNPYSIMWIQRVDAGTAIFNFGYNLALYGFIILFYFYHFRDVNIIEVIKENGIVMIDVLFMLLTAVFFIVVHATNALVASTIRYAIQPTQISFIWKKFKKHNVSVAFYKITAINKVNYDHGRFSTIYFGTSESYKINKMDFDKGESRVHITFEKVKNGDEVFDLLNTLWKRALQEHNKYRLNL